MTASLFAASVAAWRATNSIPRPITPPLDAVVKLSIRAVDGARTADTLGAEREGTGIVIDSNGLILTIGYLVLEAASILVMTGDNRIYPASVVGFDHATGFGLLRASPPPPCAPVELGDSSNLGELQSLVVAGHAGAGGVTGAALVSRRRFIGWWEYMIDDALFTAPPRYEHSGAALFDGHGRLVGIASLWVSDALNAGVAFPGNMFVPINLLKDVLDDLVRDGRRRGAARPWLGLNTEQVDGHLVVTRVLPDSPADQSGLKRGDIILGIGGDSIGSQSEFYESLWSSSAGSDVTLHIVRDKVVKHLIVQTSDRLSYLRPWHMV
ncbi:MAG: S1C family serine protease [Burkholderiales bacterium]|jgi:S1-C subfamily serine protease|nr:S1C family serine protease [Burkholderiales bacterium]